MGSHPAAIVSEGKSGENEPPAASVREAQRVPDVPGANGVEEEHDGQDEPAPAHANDLPPAG